MYKMYLQLKSQNNSYWIHSQSINLTKLFQILSIYTNNDIYKYQTLITTKRDNEQ